MDGIGRGSVKGATTRASEQANVPLGSQLFQPLTRPISVRNPANAKNAGKSSTVTGSFRLAVNSRATRLSVDPEWIKSIDLHVHIPKAAATRDAASVGVTIFVAVMSLISGVPMRSDVAVAGELTLRGLVLPIPEVKAKLLAAHRAGIKSVVLPERNRVDLAEVPASVLETMEIHFIRRVEEALGLCLEGSGQAGGVSRPSTPAPAFPPA